MATDLSSLDTTAWDLLIVGGGTAGLPAAIAAADTGKRVLLVEKADELGGTLHVSGGQMSAGGTRIQARHGITDSPEAHLADIERMTTDVPDMALVRRAVEEAPGTIDWLDDLGFVFDDACPAASHFNVHDPYSAPRVYWGPRFGASILEVLLPEMGRVGDRVTVATATELVDLATEGGSVTGAVLRQQQATASVHASAVLLATGGYGAAPELFEELSGYRLVSAAMPTSTGDGIRLARERVDAALRASRLSLPTFGGFEDPAHEHVALPWDQWPVLTPQLRAPWEIFVNLEGERFIREDEPDVHTREHALRQQPATTFWVVTDTHARRSSPPLVPAWSDQELEDRTAEGEVVVRADTLEELATATGVPAATLIATVEDYNQGVAAGHDRLGRQHLPAALEQPPYTAIRNHATTLRTHAGVAVDEDLRVLSEPGTPVDGLFAAGEVLGGVSMSGDGFAAGMSVTPALALGRWAGRVLG